MMRWSLTLACVLVCLQCAAAATPTEAILIEWKAWKLKYGKKYESDHASPIGWWSKTHRQTRMGREERYRLSVWLENRAMIEQHNQLYYEGVVSYDLKMNNFGDLTHEEFRVRNGARMPAGYVHHAKKQHRNPKFRKPQRRVDVPDEWDWVEQGAVTGVKNQGQCGSCWTFSATGAIEGMHMIFKGGELMPLSEQQILSCPTQEGGYGVYGCQGGWVTKAFEYVKDNDGIETEDDFGYTASDQTPCQEDGNYFTTVGGWENVPQGDEEALKKAVAKQPVSVAIDASHNSFQWISDSTVYAPPNCDSYTVDHAVLVVGYGTKDGEDYWKVKNSWGTGWGDQGYFYLARGSNMCGVASYAAYPTP